MNRLDLGETLIRVVDSGSLVAAAKRLRITTAAVSKKISKLEEHLSVKLLDRARGGVQLTEAGQIYYHQIKKILEDVNQFENSFRKTEQEVKGRLRVVSNRFFLESRVIPRLKAWMEKFPKLELEFYCAEVIPDFDETDADLILGVSLSSIQEGVMRLKVGSTRYVIAGAPQYFSQAGVPRTPPELLQHRFVVHAARSQPDRILLDGEQELRVQKSVLANDTSVLTQLALEGVGLIWTHEMLVSEWIKKDLLKTVLNSYLTQEISIYAYYPVAKAEVPAVREFVKFLRQAISTY